MTSNKFMTLDISWSYPCVCLTGSQFWRSSRKILVAKKSEMANPQKGNGKIKKAAKTGDILERLQRIVSDDSEEEDDLVDTRPVSSSSERPIKKSLSRNSTEEEVAKVLKSILSVPFVKIPCVCLLQRVRPATLLWGASLVLSNGMLLAPMLHNAPCVVLL